MKKAVSLSPDDVLILFDLGMVYAELRNRHKAVETLFRFLSIADDAPEHLKRAAGSTIARMQGAI